ncbi:hypothetical protein CEXT_410811 [Caerostris extrusa]|uniref:Uncharacterized protein n=1 Tax=Caerostris extrusa TaxID=172846 RepID=A0AAV4XZ20_CAEEX|nr:hypothetical protein CEXT_410811 [Caerostris extrusa]
MKSGVLIGEDCEFVVLGEGKEDTTVSKKVEFLIPIPDFDSSHQSPRKRKQRDFPSPTHLFERFYLPSSGNKQGSEAIVFESFSSCVDSEPSAFCWGCSSDDRVRFSEKEGMTTGRTKGGNLAGFPPGAGALIARNNRLAGIIHVTRTVTGGFLESSYGGECSLP